MDALLAAPGGHPVLPGPALTECIVASRRAGNTSSPEQSATTLTAVGVRVEHPVDPDLVRAAELLEASVREPGKHPRTGDRLTLSLADALILAVAERLGVSVVTKDRYWSELAARGHTSVTVIQL